MLSILDNKNLKAGEKLEKVFSMLYKKALLVKSSASNHKPIQ